MGLSQEQLSEILEISPNHLSVIETGGKFVTSRLLEKMVFVFKIPPSLLFYSPLLQNPNVTSKQISQISKLPPAEPVALIRHKWPATSCGKPLRNASHRDF